MGSLRAIAAWLAVLGTAAYVRLSWVRCVSMREGFDFSDPDSLYHLRQIRDGPIIQDWMLPDGVSPWPGGFDVVLAVLVRLGRLFGIAGAHAEEALIATVLVLVSLATVVLTRQVARATWGDAAGWIAAALAAVVPAAIDRSRFGTIDHHLVEPIILLLALHPGIRARGRGIAIGVGLVIAQSMMVTIGIAAIAMLSARWLARRHGETDSPSDRVTDVATTAFLAGAPLVIISAYAHGVWFDFRIVGLFQLGLIAVWALASPAVDGSPARWIWQRAVAAGILLAALAVPLAGSADFLSQNAVLELSGETDSAFAARAFRLGFLTDLVWLGHRAYHNGERATLELSAAATLALVTFTSQVRFSAVAAAMFAVTAAGAIAVAGALLQKWLSSRIGRQRAVAVTAVAVVAVLVMSLRPYANDYAPDLVSPRCSRRPEKRARLQLCRWFAKHTPPQRDRADYRVMAPWWLGHHMIYLAGRAPVATPFIFDRDTVGLTDSLAFYFADDSSAALARLQRLGVRYVVVPSLDALCREAKAALRVVAPDLVSSFDRSSCTSAKRAQVGWQLHRRKTLQAGGVALVFRFQIRQFPSGRALFRVFELETTN